MFWPFKKNNDVLLPQTTPILPRGGVTTTTTVVPIPGSVIALQFMVHAKPKLISEKEHLPFATCYMSSDIRATPTVFFADTYRNRLKEGISSKKAEEKGKDDAEQKKALSSLNFEITFSVTVPERPFDADASVCVQAFCEIANHKQERCCHRCGFSAFALRGMAIEATKGLKRSFTAVMSDNGPGIDKRGTVTIIIPETTVRALSSLRFSEPLSDDLIYDIRTGLEKPENVMEEVGTCMSNMNEYVDKLNITYEGIRVPKLPPYILSGGMTLPPCAFIVVSTLPKTTEEHYLNVLDIVLERRFLRTIPDKEKRLSYFLSTYTEGAIRTNKSSGIMDDMTRMRYDECGCILADVVMAIPSLCPYLFDMGISGDGTRLVGCDEFTRTLCITLSADCEDDVFHAIMLAHDILVAHSSGGRWTSEALRVLQLTRAQYIGTAALKAVTRPSISNSQQDDNLVTLAAHDSCDFIPVSLLKRWLTAGIGKIPVPSRSLTGKPGAQVPSPESVIAAIEEERKSLLIHGNEYLSVVISEGTGLVSSFIRNPDEFSPWARRIVKPVAIEVFTGLKFVAKEDMRYDSMFYKYATVSIVHDTIFSPAVSALARSAGVGWLVPQITFCTQSKDGITYGADHADYVSGSTSVVAITSEPITRRQMDIILHLEKFEHPILPLEPVPRDPMIEVPNFAVCSRRLERLVKEVREITRQREHHGATPRDGTVADIEVCGSLWELTDQVAESIKKNVSQTLAIIDMDATARYLTSGVSIVTLFFRVKSL